MKIQPDGTYGECDFCGFETNLAEYSIGHVNPIRKCLCYICYSVVRENHHRNPNDSSEVLQAICFIGNEIIKAIKKE